MSATTLQDRIKKYGEAGRHVYLLERELESRETRQSILRSSLALNLMSIVVIIYLLVRP